MSHLGIIIIIFLFARLRKHTAWSMRFTTDAFLLVLEPLSTSNITISSQSVN